MKVAKVAKVAIKVAKVAKVTIKVAKVAKVSLEVAKVAKVAFKKLLLFLQIFPNLEIKKLFFIFLKF